MEDGRKEVFRSLAAKMCRAIKARSRLIHRLFTFRVVKRAHTASIQANICRLEREISSIQDIMSSLKIRCSMSNGCSCNYCKLPLENQQEPNFCQQRRTFSKFMSLPYKLRLQIWELADVIFQAPRVVEVKSRKDPAGAK
jgi:hypothetical protein